MVGPRASSGLPRGAAASGPFVGRVVALRELLDAVELARSGEAVVALVAGEPGIGKTRLVAEVASRVSCRVVWAACWDGDGAPPFWPWVQLVRALPGHEAAAEAAPPGVSLAELVGLDAHGDAAAAHFQLFDAVADAVEAACATQPLMAVIDDLQWADPGSWQLLRFLARDPRARRLAIVGTYREEVPDGERAVGELVGGGVHLRLGGMTPAEVGELARQLRDDGAAIAADLHRRSGGNPLFVREFVRLTSSGGAVEVPAGVRAVVGLRLDALPVETHEVLTVASVLGAEFDVAVLVELSGTATDAVHDALERARIAGLVSRDPGGRSASFVHAVVQEMLLERLGAAARSRLHTRAADVVERRTGDRGANEVANHLVLAGRHDERTLAAVVAAADQAATVLGYEQAAVWYGHALDMLPAGDIREAELLVRRGEAWIAAGDRPSARDSFDRAARVAAAHGDADRLARAALGFGAGEGGFEVPQHDRAQIVLLERALDALGDDPSELKARVLARLSVALSAPTDRVRRRELSEAAIANAREVEHDAALGHALAAHCDVVAGPDDCELREAEASEIIELARRTRDPALELLGLRLRLQARLEIGDMTGADEDRDAFAGLADELRQPQHRWYVPLWRGMRSLMLGDLATARSQCELAEQLGARAASANAYALAMTQRWVLERVEGRFSHVAEWMSDALGLAAGGTPIVSGADEVRLRALMAVHRGDLDRAHALLDAVAPDVLAARPRNSEWLPETAQLAQVAVATGHDDAAAALFAELEPYAHRYCVEGIGAAFTGSVAWYLARLAEVLGDDAAVRRYDDEAATAHRRVGMVGDPPPIHDADARRADRPRSARAAAHTDGGPATLVNEGATWAVSFAGTTRRVRDSKGLRDIATLVTRPGREVHCLELAGGVDVGGDTGARLDDRARLEYQQRIRELQDDVDEARDANDPVRAERAEAELDALVDELSKAFGLSGRARGSGAAAERARSAVTARIRAAIKSARDVHPELARHLDHSIRTGVWCSYVPEHPITWQVDRGQE